MNMQEDSDYEYERKYSYPSPEEAMKPYVWEGWQTYDHEESEDSNHQSADPTLVEPRDEAYEAEEDPLLEGDPNDDGDPPSEATEETNNGFFDLESIFQRMDQIGLEGIDKLHQLDHDEAIRQLVSDIVSPIEGDALFMSAERIEAALKHVPENQELENAIASDPEILQSIERYRKHFGDVLCNMTELMLAAGPRNNVPVDVQGWLLLLIANASRDCRDRITTALTNTSINPACIQYASGQKSWGPDMLDTAPKIDLEDPSACGDAVTAYLIICHLSKRKHYAYSGSATNTSAELKEIGETLRMKVHSRILALGHEEVCRRRRVDDSRVFKVHEHLSAAGYQGYSFFPAVRIPVDLNDPNHLISATLVLIAEVVNMVLFDTCSSDPVPRIGRTMVFIDQTHKLMKRLRPKDCPVAPWEGMNRVIPLQMPKAVWGLLRQAHQRAPMPQLMSQLRTHFEETRNRKDVCTLKRLYATILNENGLTYKNAYQEFLYMRCVLWHSMIVVAEKGLVSFQDGKYHLEIGALDWNFSREKCIELYRDSASAYFNQQVLFPMIWDTLRDGVPTKYAYSKARHYLPPPIRTRIQDICKYMLIQNNNSIVRSETVVRTSEKHVVSIENLQKRVLKQLEKDVSLSTRVKVREGIWEDMAFLEYVADHVRFTHRELQEGISPEEAKNWGNLEALQPSWALKSAQGPNVEYLPESVIVNALDPMLLPALPDTPRYVIEQMNFLQDKQAEFEPLSNSENRLGPRSKTRPGGTAEPFDLGDGRGIALSTRVFSMETEEDTSGVGQTASGSDVWSATKMHRPVSEGPRILFNASLAYQRAASVRVSPREVTSTLKKPKPTARDAGGPSCSQIWRTMYRLVKADAAVVPKQICLVFASPMTTSSATIARMQARNAYHFRTITCFLKLYRKLATNVWVPQHPNSISMSVWASADPVSMPKFLAYA
ncbi:hypothetical protein EDB82DRAFT_521098 [Fusarium venenatum]|uniref:uncharacterized protein n=1 Tax=Fusarium venenatum TaxID=56646 RepID=UPI001D65FC6F|nr:hypothetical protein EDB82DRAFT_521098 [Fusarium venenatum]